MNGRPGVRGYALRGGDTVSVEASPDAHSVALAPVLQAQSAERPFDVVFEDPHIIVINKPRGLVVHPAPGHPLDTLVNVLVSMSDSLSEVAGDDRPGIVHRLDKDTTGLMVVAKTDAACLDLQSQIQRREAERVYVGIVWGAPRFTTATVRASIGRHPRDRKRMAVLPDGASGAREAVTDLTVLGRYGPFAEIEAKLQTGRTHQIRVHCAYIGHPVVGDGTYGGTRHLPTDRVSPSVRARVAAALDGLGGQALHAVRLRIRHPVSGEVLTFRADPPADMAELQRVLRECYAD